MVVRVKEQGITLVALVITIIVLLILAGVSIATLSGDNGILTNANRAKAETEKQAVKEKVELALLESYDKRGNIDYNALRNNLKDLGASDSEVPEPITKDNFPLKINIDGYDVTINEDEKVTVSSITGNVSSDTLDDKTEENKFYAVKDGVVMERLQYFKGYRRWQIRIL